MTTFLFSRVLNNDAGGWAGYTLRQSIAAAQLTGAAGNPVFTFRGGSGQGLDIVAAYVQTKGAGAFDFSGAPIPITFNGGNAGAVIGANTPYDSDPIPIAITGASDIVISVYLGGASTFRRSNVSAGTSTAYRNGNDAVTVLGSGYSVDGTTNVIESIVVGVATDASIFQAALIVPTEADADAQVFQSALIAPVSEQSFDANVMQMAIIMVSTEYVIPIIPVPISIGQFLATMPYWVGRNH